MREHHRVDETDAMRRCAPRRGTRTRRARRSRRRSSRRRAIDSRNFSNSHNASIDCTMKPPPKASRLNSAASVYTMRRDWRSGAGGAPVSTARRARKPAVDERRHEAQQRVEHEHRLHGDLGTDVQCLRRELRDAGEQRAGGSGQRADQAVAGEHGRALPIRDDAGQHRLLQRQEDADVAARRVERADDRDDQQRPEVASRREPQPGRGHQRGGRQKQRSIAEAVRVHADRQRQERRIPAGSRSRSRPPGTA